MTCKRIFPRFLSWKTAFLCLGVSISSLCARPVLAQETQATPSAQEGQTNLRYAVMIHGYHVLDATASYAMRPWGYGGTTHLYTVGLASWFLTANLTSTVEGRFDGDKAIPLSFDNQGYSRGKERHAHLTFDQAGPHITALTPIDDDREPLPKEELSSSLDMLSALAALLHNLEHHASCTMAGNVFDGLRLFHIDAQGPHQESIPEGRNPYYTGTAFRCDFSERQIGGFVKGSHHKAEQASPHPGTAWLKRLDNGQVVPVRIELQHPKLGKMVFVLQSLAYQP
ncbi:DUF3108 domain-containing protein [Saccharibacter sp. 17.LH.SD]|uniref:DUF3108 domain-containing protein n=1 Tax=Saccharibacter sp. 17.LH.SD TaxID=2689393 RepID=UPI00136EF340|nr:DUF3108 domain-containing protein [Saccharibacter sp. 17.LH.SD]MXV44453.1 DUF3108 domain-containing protein [Saccharibacter sp. 17.LH.SD]